MNGLLMPVIFLFSMYMGAVYGIPVDTEESELNGSPYDYTYGYPVMEKRPSRPSLADYLRLAAMQYELDKEEAVEAAEAQNAEVLGQVPSGEALGPETHSVDKRRRRYGFWVTAINKMGNGGKRSVRMPRGHPMLMG